MPKDKHELDLKEFCKKNFPNLEYHLAFDDGEILIAYLRDHKGNFGLSDIVVYYNIWYTGEFNISKITPVSLEEVTNASH